MNASILILTGPPGAGKTTAARSLAERSARSVHVESDAFFRFVRSGIVEPWRPESHCQNEVAVRAVAASAVEYAAGGYFTIVDGIVLPRWFLEPLRAAFEGLWRQFADLGELEGHAVDVTELTSERAVELIATRLEDGSLAL